MCLIYKLITMDDKNISPEESLQIIEKMLADARNRFYNNGFSFLFWGVLIILACITQYVMIKAGYAEQSNYMWLYVVAFGIVVTFLYFRYYAPKRKSSSRLDAYNGMIWMGFGITYIVVVFLCIALKIYPVGFIWALSGFGMFASGGIYKYRPFYFGAIVFWASAIITVYLGNSTNELWACALTMFVGYVIPGYLLWRKAKKEANV